MPIVSILRDRLRTLLTRFHFQFKLKRILGDKSLKDKSTYEIFSGVTDEFWYWLHTVGYKNNAALRNILPGSPDEDIQLRFTALKGDMALWYGFVAYKLFKDLYAKHIGPINQCSNILDFGCGWGRIIRFFMKDMESSKIWGCDPVEQMIAICKQQNKWCNFTQINTRPPTPYADNTFDLIYSFSVFSHLSEEISASLLAELTRILKPGGMLIVTTRPRDFIEHCAELRRIEDLNSIHPGPRSSVAAFLNTEESLSDYDTGKYCFSQLVHEGEWSYWGDAAISKEYVLKNWTNSLTFIDYLDDQKQINQNAIVMKKPAVN